MKFVHKLLLIIFILVVSYGIFIRVSEVQASKDRGCEYEDECSTSTPDEDDEDDNDDDEDDEDEEDEDDNDDDEDCDECSTPEPTVSPSPTPSPTPTPSLSPTPEPTQTPDPTATPTPAPTENPGRGGPSGGPDGGDGRSDGLGCGSHDCSGNTLLASVLQGEVLGISTGPAVLGLSFTGSEDEGVNSFVDTSLSGVKIQVDPANLTDPVKVLNSPSNINIPALGIDLPVAEAKVENGLWQNFDTVASHGIGSANPGEGSNVVISAHAKWNLFGNLKFAEKGQEIIVSTKSGKHLYKVSEIKEVTPDQVNSVAPTNEETLTLYTCVGENDEKRLVVIADSVK